MKIKNALLNSIILFFVLLVRAGDHEEVLKKFQEEASKSQRLSNSLKSSQAAKNIQLTTKSIKKINEWVDLVEGYRQELETPCKLSSQVIKIARVIRARALIEAQNDGDAWHILHQKSFQVDRSLRNCFCCFACNTGQTIEKQQAQLRDACQDTIKKFNDRSEKLIKLSQSDVHIMQEQFSDQLPVAQIIVESPMREQI